MPRRGHQVHDEPSAKSRFPWKATSITLLKAHMMIVGVAVLVMPHVWPTPTFKEVSCFPLMEPSYGSYVALAAAFLLPWGFGSWSLLKGARKVLHINGNSDVGVFDLAFFFVITLTMLKILCDVCISQFAVFINDVNGSLGPLPRVKIALIEIKRTLAQTNM